VSELQKSTPGDSKELPVFACAETSMPFRDVACNRYRRTSDLAGNAEKLFLGKSFGQLINNDSKLDRPLPNEQITK
jgi:hypothetical protein